MIGSGSIPAPPIQSGKVRVGADSQNKAASTTPTIGDRTPRRRRINPRVNSAAKVPAASVRRVVVAVVAPAPQARRWSTTTAIGTASQAFFAMAAGYASSADPNPTPKRTHQITTVS